MNSLLARARPCFVLAVSAAATATASQAGAQVIPQLDGVVVATCSLLVSSNGTLGFNAGTGTEIGSEQAGGMPATITITATAAVPTLSFTAPTMSIRPGAYTGSPTISIRYTSLGAAPQNYTSLASSFTSSRLTDTITLHARATDNSGFAPGAYRIQTTVTCSQ